MEGSFPAIEDRLVVPEITRDLALRHADEEVGPNCVALILLALVRQIDMRSEAAS